MFLHCATPRRISTDIDIMTPVSGDDLLKILRTVAEGDLMQIAKQFFDVATLFDLISEPIACLPAWQEHVKKEAIYREPERLEDEERALYRHLLSLEKGRIEQEFLDPVLVSGTIREWAER